MPNRWCIVPGCPSNQKHNFKNVNFFSARGKVAIWRNHIPNARHFLKDSHFICARHFESKYVKRCWVSGEGDRRVEILLKRPKLIEGAVPTIFPTNSLIVDCEDENVVEESIIDQDDLNAVNDGSNDGGFKSESSEAEPKHEHVKEERIIDHDDLMINQ